VKREVGGLRFRVGCWMLDVGRWTLDVQNVTANHAKYTKRSLRPSATDLQDSPWPLCLSGENNHGDTESTEKLQTRPTPPNRHPPNPFSLDSSSRLGFPLCKVQCSKLKVQGSTLDVGRWTFASPSPFPLFPSACRPRSLLPAPISLHPALLRSRAPALRP
jgi:hypothetical protein